MTTQSPAVGMTSLPTAGTNWQSNGLCRQVDTDMFFPSSGESAAYARRVCAACEVRRECLEYALAHDERGVWGATTYNQRQAILRARRKEPAPVPDRDRAERNRTILQLTQQGETAKEIATRLGCAARTITRVRVAAQKRAAA
jgi:WhiB family redox-sensing transcriptional regulator